MVRLRNRLNMHRPLQLPKIVVKGHVGGTRIGQETEGMEGKGKHRNGTLLYLCRKKSWSSIRSFRIRLFQ